MTTQIEKNKEKSCKVVTITSGKGGTGKTVFAINFALALSSFGMNVVIFDADLGMANVDVLLKINTRNNLMEVMEGRKKIQDILLQTTGGITIVPGASGIQELASLSAEQFQRLLEAFSWLENKYDYVIVDTGAGLSKNVTNFILASHETVVITTPEPHAITDAYAMMKVMIEQCKSLKIRLVVNKCENSKEGMLVSSRLIDTIKQFMGTEIESMGFITESKYVTRSIKEQNPFYLSYPNSDASRDIKSLAMKEAGMAVPANTGWAERFSDKLAGLFKAR